MLDRDYRSLHERFMQNHTGTTPLETVLVIAPIAACTILAHCGALLSGYQETKLFALEFGALVLPLVLHATILAEHIAPSLVILLGISVFLATFIINNKKRSLDFPQLAKAIDTRLLITSFRGTVSLITAICILAVDFQSFPRRFAKTETYGWGLMDTGVGLFVVANGVVEPETRGRRRSSPGATSQRCIPLIIMGVVRWLTTSGLHYQHHVSEYGLHWNFFITLALARIGSSYLLQLTCKYFNYLALSVVTLIIHQVLLSNGVDNWVLSNTPRASIISANREGLCSLLGYIGLHQGAIALGHWLNSANTQKNKGLVVLQLMVPAILTWTIAILSGPPSRRLANLSYVTWMMAYSLTLLVLLLGAQIICISLSNISHSAYRHSALVAAINFNPLGFFLLANLLTGAVNLSVHTLYVSSIGSVVILSMYMFLVCFTMQTLFTGRIKLKFW